MSLTVTIALHAAVILSLIVVHEMGHYLAARIAGVSGNDLRIALFRLPPHVALADGKEWVGPRQAERYGEILQQRLSGSRSLFWFVAAGLTVQTLYAVLLFFVLAAIGASVLGWMGLSYSAAMLIFYLGFDPMMTWISGHQTGDITAMFAVAPLRATVTLLAMVALHAVLLYLFY